MPCCCVNAYGLPARVGVEAGEVERAAEVGAVVEAAAAPVRQLEAGLDQVMALRPRQALVQVDVRLGAHQIGLPAAAGERAGDDDACGPASALVVGSRSCPTSI